jgi:hypothetical protein
MKRILILALILACFAAIAYYLINKGNAEKKGMVTADRGFTVQSIDEVTKIVIKHKKLQPIIFERKGKEWIMNGKYDVDPGVFINVEKVLTDMRMLYIPPAGHTKTIMNSIANNGIQVDLYNGEAQPFKIFFIGTDVQNSAGTHMIMAGETQPYVMHLPGLEGGLRSRFEQPAKNYRDKFIYKFPSKTIDQVKIEYPKDNFSSFVVKVKGDQYELSPLLEMVKPPAQAINQMKLKKFIDQFEYMGTEGLVSDIPEIDSIASRTPICIFTVTKKDGSIHTHKYYSYDDYVEPGILKKTPAEIRGLNRVFIYTDTGDMYTSQNRVVGGIFMGYSDFFGGEIPKSIIPASRPIIK